MAIINLNCNLNGGDTVTPNNELFYRIYGDVDNYASPIHTTGTAIADDDVTVNGDIVDISSVDGGEGNAFKISAVDESGNESTVSDAYIVVVSPILVHESFDGAVIDTALWDITDTSAGGSATQNDMALMDSVAASGSVPYGELWWYQQTDRRWNLSGVKVVSFDARIIGTTTSNFQIGILSPGLIYRLSYKAGAAEGQLGVETRLNNGTTVSEFVTPVNAGTELVTFRFSNDGTKTSSHYWNSDVDAWWNLGTDFVGTVEDGEFYLQCQLQANIAEDKSLRIDNIYISSELYSTRYPE